MWRMARLRRLGLRSAVGAEILRPRPAARFARPDAAMAAAAGVVPPDPPLEAAVDGWYLDPLGRFLMRYWDGSRWTGFVSDGRGDESVDLPWALLTSRWSGALSE